MARESAFNRFRREAVITKQCEKKRNSSFITQGTNSTTITSLRTDKELNCALTFTDKEGGDEVLLFTNAVDDIIVGDYFTWLNNGKSDSIAYLVYEDVRIASDVAYKKQKVLECNVKINDNFYGYFKGNLRSYKDIQFSSSTGYEQNKLSPILVMAQNSGFEIKQDIIINKQKWTINDADLTTNDKIGYYYLERAMNDLTIEDNLERISNDTIVYSDQVITVPTNDQYFETSTKVIVVSKTINSITFKVPNGIDKITIKTKLDKEILSTTYTVKEII